MKNSKLELIAGEKMKILGDIFQGDSLSQLLLVIAVMSLNYILRRSTGGNTCRKSQEKFVICKK